MRTKETLNKGTKAQEKKENKNQTLIKTELKKKKKKTHTHTHTHTQHNTTCSEAHVQLTHEHFYPSLIKFSPTKFSPHFGGENFLVGLTIIFPSPSQTPSKKVFLHPFFFHPP